MTFKEIYERILPMWGSKIGFKDGLSTLPKNAIITPGASPNGNDYFYSKEMSMKWDEIEDIVCHDDTFGDLMVWTMYQVFNRHARKLCEKGIYSLNPQTLEKKEIEVQYFLNLNEESWEFELSQYERLID